MATLTPNGDAEVQIAIAGRLKKYSTDQTVTAVTSYNIDTRVPTGKRWVFKAIKADKVSGTFTVGTIRLYVLPDGANDVELYSVGAATLLKGYGDQDITLDEGAIIRCRITVTAHTVDGIYRPQILVQEMDSN